MGLLESVNIITTWPNHTGLLGSPIISFHKHNSDCSNIRNRGMLIIRCNFYLRFLGAKEGMNLKNAKNLLWDFVNIYFVKRS